MRSPAAVKNGPTTRRVRPAPRVRRGSALVIVIGTLALISVFAAIYIAVGQSDRQSAATVRTRTDLSEITGAYADHVARVIGADRLDTIMQPVDSARQFQVPRRVTTDAPYTDWSLRSETDELWRLFNPPGGNLFARPRNQTGDDPRVASDPWLASLRPTYLGDPNFRPFSGNNPAKHYLDNRDWYQISNFAEDGRFVNLFNLRPESGFSTDGTAFGGFESEPGYGVSIDSAGRRIRRMSEGLSLYTKLIPNDPNSPIQSYNPDPAGDGVPALRGLLWFPGASLPVLPVDFTGNFTPQDYRNTPAIFTMYQRYAFLPADQPFVTYNRFGNVSSWADPDYPPYQWADADGDGMYDARWIELKSARSPAPSGRARDDIQRFYDDSEYRVFAAIRAVDLSGMVNVNTAVDALTPPTVDFPLGLTPAEVDLRRLLTQQDSAADYRGDPAATIPLSFRYIHQPYNIQGTGTQPALRIETDYRIHQHTLDPGTGLLNPDTSGMLMARYAAAAARRGMQRHATLSPQYRGFGSVAPDLNDPFLLQEGSSLQRPIALGNPETDFDYYAGGRAATYFTTGRLDPSRMGPGGLASYGNNADDYLANTDYFDAPNDTLPDALYGVTDLAELLTYHGINDPAVTSRLEANMQGRFDGPNGEARLSPLLSTRTLDLDRYTHGQVRVPPANTNPNRPRQINGQIAEDSMALFELSPRSVMTTLSGAAPLRPMGVAGGTVQAQGSLATNIQPAGLADLSVSEAAITLADIAEGTDSRDAFNVFYNALAGELELFRQKRSIGQDGPPPGVINQVWQPDLFQSRALPYATTFYAHRGPELAMRIAAHAGVNLKDMYDGNDLPSYGSLVLDNEFGDSAAYGNLLSAITNNPTTFNLTGPSGLLGVYYPGLVGNGRFDIDGPRAAQTPNPLPDDQRVLPDARLPAGRQAVNVVGVEPTPVITEVASFYVYADTSEDAGGDVDYNPAPVPGGPIPLTTAQVTIDGSVDGGNSDLLAAVIAVQLHNPFDTEISLGGSGSGPNGIMWRKNDNGNRFDPQNNLEFDYYIEYNGYFFKLGEFWEFTPQATLPSGFGASQTNITDAGGSVPPEDSRLDSTYPEFQYRNVTLEPGETRVFYASFHPRFEGAFPLNPTGLENTWVQHINAYGTLPAEFTDTANFDADGDGRADGNDNRGWTGPAQEWIERQLAVLPENGASGLLRAARMHPFDPTTGELVNPATGASGSIPVFQDLIGTPGSLASLPGRSPDNSQVRLWRKYAQPNYEEATGETIANFPNATRRNLIQNDILVDRLYLANQGDPNYLDVALPGGNPEIAGTVSFPEDYLTVSDPCNSSALNIRNDNTGLSVTRWAYVRRRDQPASLGDETANGRVLPWMIQSRLDRASTWSRNTNEGSAFPGAIPDSLTWREFFDLCNPGDRPNSARTPVEEFGVTDPRRYDIAYSPGDLYNEAILRRGSRVATIGNTPFNKRDPALLGDSGARFPAAPLGSNRLTAAHELFAANSPLKPEIFIGKTLDSARIGEALLALGTGPTWAPVVRPLNNYDFEDREWMTLTESFAAALGYERFDFSDPLEIEAANAVWHDAARDVIGSTQGEYVLDNLRLRLDDYVAFLNIQNTGETGPNEKPAFTNDPGNPNITDYRRGLGIPLALTVIDQIRPFEVLDLPGDANLSPEDTERLPLTRPIMGLVNIQTAPLRVLRLLPGLTPSPEIYRAQESSSGTSARRPEWWGAPFGLATNAGAAELLPADPRTNPDIAAGIAAYRDRTAAMPRARSTNTALEPLTYQPDPATNAGWAVQNMRAEVVNTVFPVDRAGISGIPGLRTAPMFGSLGELLAVAVREPASGFSDPLADNRRHLTVQAYFGDGDNLGVDDSNDPVTIDPSVSRDAEVGVTEDDYAERLAVAAGLFNNTTVRSDYFAVWMVLQGFRESDVTRLRPEDPLVPSFKKRYLMVIDRSNVLSPEDQPRIVLFKELPL